jgi:16S rRNA (guanine527-N7)-methyltransferase
MTTPLNAAEPADPLLPALRSGIDKLELRLDDGRLRQLLHYLRLIERWNRVYNLTAVREPQAMLTQHLLDCLAIVPALERGLAAAGVGQGGAQPLRLLDVGSGAGLPGVILAICRPDWQITCVDAVAKKASFIRQVAAELGLSNLAATHQRVEAMGPDARFDLITSRAFSTLADLVDLTRERLAPGGCWAAMKAKLQDGEANQLPTDVALFHVEPLAVPGLDAARCLAWIRPLQSG